MVIDNFTRQILHYGIIRKVSDEFVEIAERGIVPITVQVVWSGARAGTALVGPVNSFATCLCHQEGIPLSPF